MYRRYNAHAKATVLSDLRDRGDRAIYVTVNAGRGREAEIDWRDVAHDHWPNLHVRLLSPERAEQRLFQLDSTLNLLPPYLVIREEPVGLPEMTPLLADVTTALLLFPWDALVLEYVAPDIEFYDVWSRRAPAQSHEDEGEVRGAMIHAVEARSSDDAVGTA